MVIEEGRFQSINKIKNDNVIVSKLIEFFIDINTNNYEKDFGYGYSMDDKYEDILLI